MTEQQTKERRIETTGQITRAMKMMAASKLEKSKRSITLFKPYIETLTTLFSEALSLDQKNHPLLVKRSVKKTRLLFRSSDKGFCAGLNSTLFTAIKKYYNQAIIEGKEVQLLPIGKKGVAFLAKENIIYKRKELIYTADTTLPQTKEIGQLALEAFLRGDCDEVVLAYQGSVTPTPEKVTFVSLLPLLVDSSAATPPAWICEPDAAGMVAAIAPRMAYLRLYENLLAAELAEHKVRMLTMHQASENAAKMVQGLRLDYHRARQAAITQELNEIIAHF